MTNDDNALCLKNGVELEEYRIDGVLGKGGFAITYSAVDQRLQKRVAIKELLPDGIATRVDGHTVMAQTESLREDYEWAIDSFIKEAQTIAGFEHPNIVRVLRFFRANGTAYMVMPLIEGSDLKKLIKQRGVYAYPDLLQVLNPLLQGLAVVHHAGVLHRDIKPENIYITTRGLPILIDFGAARQQVSGKSLDVTSIITPGYASIEQYSTDAKYQGPWSDLYSMAACIYHMITGRKPAPASERSDAARNQQPDPLTPLSQLRPAGYPQSFLEGVDFALQMGESQRPQSVEAWLPMLGLVQDGGAGSTSSSHSPPPMSAPPVGVGGMNGRVTPPPVHRTGGGGGTKMLIVAVLIFLMAGMIGGGAFWYMTRKKQDDKQASQQDYKPVSSVVSGRKGSSSSSDQGEANRPLLNDLEVAIKMGEYEKARTLIKELDRKNLTHSQRIRLADLRDLRESEMLNCEAFVVFQSSVSSVFVYVDGRKVSGNSGRYSLKGVGKHNLIIKASGYDDKEKIVEVTRKGQVIDLGTIRLREDESSRLAKAKSAEDLQRDRERKMEEERKAAQRKAAQSKAGQEAQLKKELVAFVDDYYQRLASNDLNTVGGLYDDYVDFEYIKDRKASRNEVKQSFGANIKRWPIRSYKSHGKTSYKALNVSATRVTLYFGYDYSYSNRSGRKAKGAAYDTVTIEKMRGRWRIVKWEQGVKRTRNDLKGL